MKPYNINRMNQIPKLDEIQVLLAAEALVDIKHQILPTDAYEIHNRILCSVARDMRSGGMKRCMAFDDLKGIAG